MITKINNPKKQPLFQMKKISILLLLIIPAFTGYAQSSKLVSAINYFKDFNKKGDIASLEKAKENIDLAAQHEDTKDDAKTQKTKGQIYLAIFENNLKLETEKQAGIADSAKRETLAYQNTPTTELDIASQAFGAAKAVDKKGAYLLDVMNGEERIIWYYTNKGAHEYNAKDYGKSMELFEKAYEVGGKEDTLLLFNIALTAELSKNFDKAKSAYNTMLTTKQGGSTTYSSLVNVQLDAKDTVGAMQVLKDGRTAYPADINLLLTETDYYIKSNKSKEALTNLNQAIAAKPEDPILYFARGNMNDNLANPKDAEGKDVLEKPKDYEEKIKLAEVDYKKAIDLNPEYFDALYNLGVLYYNHGVAITRVADKITDNAKYTAENTKANDEFKKAMPIIEKAAGLKPNDKSPLYALKQIYTRLSLTDKLKTVNDKLKG